MCPSKRDGKELAVLSWTFVRDHFFKDVADARHYNLILNFARYGVRGMR